METTYAMIGSDGQQYGPITLAQIKGWIGEGRIGSQTQVWRSDTNTWLPASQYVELGLAQPVPPAIRAPTADTRDPLLERRVRLGARWFYWIAGLSLINTLSAISGQAIVFVVGLSVTRYIYYYAAQLGSDGRAIGIASSLVAAGLFAMFGFFAWKRHTWSFVVGMILYTADSLLAIMAGGWLPVAFHLFVLFWLFQGLRANLQLKAQSRDLPA